MILGRRYATDVNRGHIVVFVASSPFTGIDDDFGVNIGGSPIDCGNYGTSLIKATVPKRRRI